MIILKNAKVYTMAGDAIEKGCIGIQDGKIAIVSQNITPGFGDEVIDLTNCVAIPGMVDAHSHLGMWEDGMESEGADGNEETDPITPSMRAIDGINPFDRCFEEAYTHGVTSVVTGPGSANVIAGQFVAIKTYGKTIEDMIIKEPAALKLAFGENPKRVYGAKERTPMTRMAIAALLRESFYAAKSYMQSRSRGDEPFDLKKEILAKALRREILVKCHAHRADDILTAMRIAKEFNLDYTIDHCTEGYLIADILKKENAKVIIGPLICERCKIELKNQNIKQAAILEKAGIDFAIMTDHPVVPEQYLPVTAAIAVREGLSMDTALKAITINAAKICGIDNVVGSIEVGKDADIAVFDDHPLDVRSKIVMVMINGKTVFRRE